MKTPQCPGCGVDVAEVVRAFAIEKDGYSRFAYFQCMACGKIFERQYSSRDQ